MQSALGCELGGVLERGLEIVAVLDQLRAERLHGAILLPAVAVRNDDGRGQSAAAGGECDALSVIAACCGDDAGEMRAARGRANPCTRSRRAA